MQHFVIFSSLEEVCDYFIRGDTGQTDTDCRICLSGKIRQKFTQYKARLKKYEKA